MIPLFAVERLEEKWIEFFRAFKWDLEWFLKNRRELVEYICHEFTRDGDRTYALTIVDEHQLTRILERVVDPEEFLSKFGVRALSKAHLQNPFVFEDKVVGYEPAEAISKIKGGNSNWRGPFWFPTSFLLLESLRKLSKAYGSDFTLTPPTEDGQPVTFGAMAQDIAERMIGIFTRDESGHRPVYGSL